MSKPPFVSLKGAAEKGSIGVSKQTSFFVDLDLIEVEPGFNRPISRENVDQIKIAWCNGATMPDIEVRVDAGRIILVDGEHRTIAAKELRAEGIDITRLSAKQFRGSDADRIAHVVTSAQNKQLTPLDAGEQFLKLIRLGWDNAKISNRIGKSVSHVAKCIALAVSNSDVQEAVRRGDISSTLAGSVVREHGDGAGAIIAEKTKEAKTKGKKRVTGAILTQKTLSKKSKVGILLARCKGYLQSQICELDVFSDHQAIDDINEIVGDIDMLLGDKSRSNSKQNTSLCYTHSQPREI